MQISVKMDGLAKVQKQLAALSGAGIKTAMSKAVNDTAFYVRKFMQAEASRVFDQPTAHIMRSFQFAPATPEKLSTEVLPTYYGGKGVDPQQILRAQEAGGTRRDKRSESALRRVGILPGGYQTSIPKPPYPGSDDGKGNLRGPFLVQLISYLQAFGEQGYRANMTDKRKKALQKGTAKVAGRRYFVSYGRLRGNRSSHLAPGIWAVSGTHGVIVQPVLMFVRSGNYTPRFSMERIAKVADVENYMSKRMRYRIRQAYESLPE